MLVSTKPEADFSPRCAVERIGPSLLKTHPHPSLREVTLVDTLPLLPHRSGFMQDWGYRVPRKLLVGNPVNRVIRKFDPSSRWKWLPPTAPAREWRRSAASGPTDPRR